MGKNTIVSKIFAILFAMLLLLMLGFGIFTHRAAAETVKRQILNQCTGIATATALLLEQDADGYQEFLQTLDTSSEYYLRTKPLLEEIRTRNGEHIAFVYTEVIVSDTEIMYVLDGEAENAPNFSPPGSLEALTEVRRSLYGSQIATSGDFVATPYGLLISAYAPILHPATGEFLGTVGVDVSIAQYNEIMRFQSSLTLVAVGLMLLIIIAFYLLSSTWLYQLLSFDSLTGVFNRAYFISTAKSLAKKARKRGESLLIVIADLDHFKVINDTYGHQFGDLVLRQSALSMGSVLRVGDCFARIGGEEFAAVLPDLSPGQAQPMLERMKNAVSDMKVLHEKTGTLVPISVSLGVAILSPGQTWQDALNRADQALYAAKQVRNTICHHEPTQGT